MTLLDFLTGGAGASLNKIGKYLGLDGISLRIWLSIAMEIVKRAASGDKPETSTMTLTTTIGFEALVKIDIGIAWFKMSGSFEVILTLVQDLVTSVPMRMFISIELILSCSIAFLFWDWKFSYNWSPEGFSPNNPYEIIIDRPSSPSLSLNGLTTDNQESVSIGWDFDNDGLSDAYENRVAGLNPLKSDSDGDNLSDKMEIYTLHTDPGKSDSDNDGIDDDIELNIKTNPNYEDTDYDGLDDYEEIAIYGTNPLSGDTDEDGLSDYYEINHAYNITGVTLTVQSVSIGGVEYNDHTDPLNKDTDSDGLFDGEEGDRGIYYGPELGDHTLNNGLEGEQSYTNNDPLMILNNGYTHPLDADTDDDSMLLLANGTVAPENKFLIDMSDYNEIKGIPTIFYDPVTHLPMQEVLVRTNPVSPDSDKDTGYVPNSPFVGYMNSDGYELSLDPASDPLDGDTDDDGLIDGLEGFLMQESNHTSVTIADTDDDGLGDAQELLLGTDPRHPDTDLDGVTDHDEFFVFGTNPFFDDTDFDGILDGEEIFFFHSSPFMVDTDADGIKDYEEVYIYFSSPIDEDSDDDFLTDFEEIKIYFTDPFDDDTDNDNILDGDEVLGLPYDSDGIAYFIYTDPLKWDTDGDSVYYGGNLVQSMSDYDEFLFGSDPTKGDSDIDGIPDGWEIW
ncbi:MAG: hypothetical protein ACXAD7_28725, partial [Candidatus Kariarchaeaceae archaeon]